MIRDIKLPGHCPIYLTGPIHKIQLPKSARKGKDFMIISKDEMKMTLETFAAISIDLSQFTVKVPLRYALVISEGKW